MEFFRIRRSIPFMRHALVFNIISLVVFLLSVVFLVTKGLNFSIEFLGGTVMEVSYQQDAHPDQVREALDKIDLKDVSVQSFGTLDVTFTDCNTATMAVTTSRAGYANTSVPLKRLTSVLDLPCSFNSTGQIDRMGRPGINTDVTRKLRAGEWSIQREIDLHGLRSDEAREALGAFIRDAYKQGVRCVRVVHGKGLGSPGRQPVLKAKVQRWLIQKNETLAFVQAKPAEGGAGALVVLLAPSRR